MVVDFDISAKKALLLDLFLAIFFRFFFVFSQHISSFEFLKGVLVSSSPGDFQCVKFDGLRERSAFTDSDNVSNLNVPETRRYVHGHVLVVFLESVVLFDVVQLISSDM